MNLLPYYPQLRFGPEGVRLYNPLLRKRYANRPEERVRLRFVDMLLHGAGFRARGSGSRWPFRQSIARRPPART